MNIFIHSYIPALSSYYREGRKEYEKRLSRYCKIKHTVYKNEKQRTKAMDSFPALSNEPGKNTLIIVTSGTEKSTVASTDLAEFIQNQGVQGISNLHFVVGFPENNACPGTLLYEPLSISRMNMPADLLSLILEEQIYRAYRIINKEPYHK